LEETIANRALPASVQNEHLRVKNSQQRKERWILDDKDKKQVPLRLSASLWKELVRWAEDDFRSLNGQIEYLLHEAVVKRRKPGKQNDSKSI